MKNIIIKISSVLLFVIIYIISVSWFFTNAMNLNILIVLLLTGLFIVPPFFVFVYFLYLLSNTITDSSKNIAQLTKEFIEGTKALLENKF